MDGGEEDKIDRIDLIDIGNHRGKKPWELCEQWELCELCDPDGCR
jgi:hypothetical protein